MRRRSHEDSILYAPGSGRGSCWGSHRSVWQGRAFFCGRRFVGVARRLDDPDCPSDHHSARELSLIVVGPLSLTQSSSRSPSLVWLGYYARTCTSNPDKRRRRSRAPRRARAFTAFTRPVVRVVRSRRLDASVRVRSRVPCDWVPRPIPRCPRPRPRVVTHASSRVVVTCSCCVVRYRNRDPPTPHCITIVSRNVSQTCHHKRAFLWYDGYVRWIDNGTRYTERYARNAHTERNAAIGTVRTATRFGH